MTVTNDLELPIGCLIDGVELRAASEAMERALPHLIEHASRTAKLRRALYVALIKEGFTEAQALDQCWRQ